MSYTLRHSIMSTRHWPLDNSYARLPKAFYARVEPTPVAKPRLLRLNRPLAEQLGLPIEHLESEEGVEVIDRDGVRRDIQLKGAGPTPFSGSGDGRAALGPVIREYVVSEGMAGLGIPTTRALAMVETGEPVYRERALPGAILT
jgi:uncharacterized protein YdiU (UPF0061 family)